MAVVCVLFAANLDLALVWAGVCADTVFVASVHAGDEVASPCSLVTCILFADLQLGRA